ncbi:MAG: zinc protease [Myxococcota bacterium]|jgi:zinc protease
MTKFTNWAVLTALLASPLAIAADAGVAKPRFEPRVDDFQLNTKQYVFPSGLTILMQSDRSHPIVSIMSLVDHGSADDPVGKEGAAHFVEHTWFRSVHGDLPPIMDVIQDLGTMFNATTHIDWTDYRTVASSEYLPLLLRLESLRLTEPYIGVTEDQIDIEREVVRNEWRRRNEQSQALMFNYIKKAVYPEDHGYSRSSTHESLDAIRLADLQKYFDDYYKPENTTIMVVGDFDLEQAPCLIYDNFDPQLLHPALTNDHAFKWPRPGVSNPDETNDQDWCTGYWDPDAMAKGKQEPLHLLPAHVRITNDRPPVPPVGSTEPLYEKRPYGDEEAQQKTKQEVIVGFSLPGGFRDDHWNLVMLGNVASGTLNYGLRDEPGLGDAFCFTWDAVVNSTLICGVNITNKKSQKDPERVAELMLNQFSELWAVPEDDLSNTFMDRMLSYARNQSLADTLLSLDVVAQHFGGRAEDIVVNAHYTGNANAYSEGMRRVMKVDEQVMRELAFEYLQRDRAAVLIIDPLEDDEIDRDNEASSYEGASAADTVLNASDDLGAVSDAQIADSYIKPDLTTIKETTLSNGLRVVALPHGEAPIAQATLVFGGGTREEPYGIMDFVRKFTTSDEGDTDPLQIAAEKFPALYDVSSNQWSSWVRAPSGNLDGAMWLLREEIATMRPYMAGNGDWVKGKYKGLKKNWFSKDWHISNMRNQHLFGDHAAGHMTSWEDVDMWSEWGASEVKTYLDTHLQPANATLMVVGKVPAQEVMKQAQKYFGGWKTPDGVEQKRHGELTTPPMPTESSRILIFDDPNRTQTDVNMSCRLDYGGIEERPTVDVMSSLLRNRVFGTLRVKEGLAYSPGAYAGASPDGSARLVFYSLAVNRGVGRTIEFFRESVEEVAAGDIQGDEVTLHKLRMAREEGVPAQSSGQLTSKLEGALAWGEDFDVLLETGNHIANVDAAGMKKLLSPCLDHAIVTLLGPKEVLTPQLDERGYEYEIVEWKARGEELLWQYDPKAAKKREKDIAKSDAKKAKDAGKEDDSDGDDD